MAECKHLLEAAFCGVCTPRGDEREVLAEPGTRFPARYHGQCGDCGRRISPGDMISPGRDELAGTWICGDCG